MIIPFNIDYTVQTSISMRIVIESNQQQQMAATLHWQLLIPKDGTRLCHIWKCQCIQPLTKHAHIVPTLLFFPYFSSPSYYFARGVEIVIDSIWRRCITEQGFVFHYFRTNSRRLEQSHHLNI